MSTVGYIIYIYTHNLLMLLFYCSPDMIILTVQIVLTDILVSYYVHSFYYYS